MKPLAGKRATFDIHAAALLVAAGAAGLCTMAYEVVWFRVLKYFVDNSIHSFAIMLTTFLFGLAAGAFVVPRFVDKRKDHFFFLFCLESAIGILCIVSIPLISGMNALIPAFTAVLGAGWIGEITARFLAFSLALFPPTVLMGAAFPVLVEMYSTRREHFGTSAGIVYSVNTLGGVIGSFCGGFVFVPLLGVQNSIEALSAVNALIGIACLWAGGTTKTAIKAFAALCAISMVTVSVIAVPQNAFLSVYSGKYPSPANTLLYCRENINGTSTVFQNANKPEQKYFLIDGTGEVSTDYFSMRAFRFLAALPALYSSDAKDALIVTFGSGIVAGLVAKLPGMEHVDCVEICKQAFDASRYFAEENHDVIHDPHVHLMVNDGRNYVFTASKRYDIISADATHPTSSDSWILYTKEFYSLCRDRLTDKGVMCQWIPLHGILEQDYRTILATFHAAFPYVAVYYSGGYKTIGHTVLVGSKSPLAVDYGKAQTLFRDSVVRRDLDLVNVSTVYDLLSEFLLDQDAIDEFKNSVKLNTDDRPCIIFSKFQLENRPFAGLTPFMIYRKNVFSQLRDMPPDSEAAIRACMDRNFQAMGFTLGGQILEFEEYNLRQAQDFNQSRRGIVKNLLESKAIFEQVISNYQSALNLNPGDRNTQYLLSRTSAEMAYLNSFLDAANGPH